jgi:hypothetical protein
VARMRTLLHMLWPVVAYVLISSCHPKTVACAVTAAPGGCYIPQSAVAMWHDAVTRINRMNRANTQKIDTTSARKHATPARFLYEEVGTQSR